MSSLRWIRKAIYGWIFWRLVSAEENYTLTKTTGPSCSVPMPPQGLSLPTCPPIDDGAALPNLEDAQRDAWKYAPIVYFHPLERYALQDPVEWFNAAEIRLWDLRPEYESTYNDVQGFHLGSQGTMLLPWSFATLLNSTKITEEERQKLLAGAPFDENGHSQANIYYTVEDAEDGLWLYNFNLYYSWNGCSNQDFVINTNGTVETVRYLMCPTGVHESDWCRVSALVCKSSGQLMQTSYSQHSWMETRDCAAGQCPTEDGHPVSYANLDGHGNYYEASDLIVYALFNGTRSIAGYPFSLSNFGGLYIGDRTARSDRKFVPTPENVKAIPSINEIVEGNLTEFEWALYPGQWGAPLTSSPVVLECLNESSDEFIECPDSRALKVLNTALKLKSITEFVDKSEYHDAGAPTAKPYSNSSFASPPKIAGPLYRQYTYKWLPQRVAPIFSENISLLVCPDDVTELSEIPGPFSWSNAGMLADYMIGIAVGSLIFSIIMAFLLFLPVILDHAKPVRVLKLSKLSFLLGDKSKSQGKMEPNESKQEVTKDPQTTKSTSTPGSSIGAGSMGSHLEAEPLGSGLGSTSTNILYIVLSGSLLLAGTILVVIGLNVMFNSSILSVVTNAADKSNIVNVIEILLTVGLSLILFFDLLSILILFCSGDKFILLFGKYRMRNLLGDRAFVKNNQFRFLLVAAGFTLLAINVSVVLFAIGWVMLTAEIGLQTVCSKVEGIQVASVGFSEVCVNIPYISEEEVCGWNILEACEEITDMRVWKIIVGSALLLWSQLVFLVMILFFLQKCYKYKISVTGKLDSVNGLATSSTAAAGSEEMLSMPPSSPDLS